MTSDGYVSAYGTGEAPLTFAGLLDRLYSTELKLVFDDGSVIQHGYNRKETLPEVFQKYLHYGVRKPAKIAYSHITIELGEEIPRERVWYAV